MLRTLSQRQVLGLSPGAGSNNTRRLHAFPAATAQPDARHGADDRAVSLAFPTFMVWGANTDVGKTLVSAGLAAAAARAKVRRLI